uniref:Uncharacterized protein n=1 Tax=Glossina pallidipes TaxID=7398 RepID=A0A1B0AIK3_GLOPL
MDFEFRNVDLCVPNQFAKFSREFSTCEWSEHSTVSSDKENVFFFASASEQSVSDLRRSIHNNHRRKPMELGLPDWYASYLLLYACCTFLIEVYYTVDYTDLLYVFLQSSFKS